MLLAQVFQPFSLHQCSMLLYSCHPAFFVMLLLVALTIHNPISQHQVKTTSPHTASDKNNISAYQVSCVFTVSLAFTLKQAVQQRTIQITHCACLLIGVDSPVIFENKKGNPRKMSLYNCMRCLLLRQFVLIQLLVNHKYNLGIVFTYLINQN